MMYRCILSINGLLLSCVIASGAKAESDQRSEVQPNRGVSFFPSWSEERDARERKLAHELRETLEMLPNIVTAKVHISFSPRGLMGSERERSGASVVIFSDKPSLVNKAELKTMVAGASAFLSVSDVGVFVYKAKSDESSEGDLSTVELDSRDVKYVWKPYAIALVLLLMCSSAVVMSIGIRRLVRRRKQHVP